jgi:hypothetical protein
MATIQTPAEKSIETGYEQTWHNSHQHMQDKLTLQTTNNNSKTKLHSSIWTHSPRVQMGPDDAHLRPILNKK